MQRFQDQVALVTGGGHGIGRATVQRLVSEGAKVAIGDIDQDAVTSLVNNLGDRVIAVRCDVTDSASVDFAVKTAVSHFGQLDVLVNTAGGGMLETSIETSTDEQWMQLLDLNLLNVMRCLRAAIPHLLHSKSGGAIVTIGSVNGLAAFGGYGYSAAKAGLDAIVKNIAAEYGPQGLRCNLIAPGTIDTRVWDNQPEGKARLERMYPLGRIGSPDDVASAVAFLASGDASWITGITLPVDGGILAGPAAVLRSAN